MKGSAAPEGASNERNGLCGDWRRSTQNDHAKECGCQAADTGGAGVPDNASALEFVKAGVADGYRFSGLEIVDREYKLVRYGYFVKTNEQLVRAGQDWGPPDPVFEPGDTYPGGPRAGKHATVLEVITGELEQKNGVGVMVILKERDVSKMN